MQKSAIGLVLLITLVAHIVHQCNGFLHKVVEFVDKALVKFDREVIRRGIKEPLEKLGKEIVEKPLRSLIEIIGVRRVCKTYKEFKQEVEHARVVVTQDSYRLEKISPCQHGHHDIAKAEQPVKFYLEDKVVVIQDRYCRKCGQHFLYKQKYEL